MQNSEKNNLTKMNPKPMKESMLERKLAFKNNPELVSKYVNLVGNMRFGLLLEYLDLLAGETTLRYIDDGRVLRAVTASIDKMDICNPIMVEEDVYFSSRVVYVGRSSVNVDIDLFSGEQKSKLANVSFTMVALDENFRPTEVRKVIPETEEEKAAHNKAKQRYEEHKNRNKQAPKLCLDDELLLSQKIEDKLMGSTKKQNIGPMYPQDQNIYGKIFGGFLMREAFELAWTTAFDYLDYKLRPMVVAIDRIDFKKPVEVGDIVEFNSMVCYTGNTSLSVEVGIRKVHSKIDNGELTNDCHFTFVAVDETGTKQKVPQVIPHTLPEAQKYLEGRRRYLERKA